jgi:hypothetical protein
MRLPPISLSARLLLGNAVVQVGMETLDVLKEFGVDAVQGYFLERPRSEHPLLAPARRLRSGAVVLRYT